MTEDVEGKPILIALDHDDYHAEHVGHTSDGRQFFLTTPFVPAPGSEFVALYLFDRSGRLLEARIDDFGPRATLNHQAREGLYRQRLEELDEVSFGRIEIAPFSVERFGETFGLIAVPPEEEEEEWTAVFEPGDYMAFSPPWDSGDYDT